MSEELIAAEGLQEATGTIPSERLPGLDHDGGKKMTARQKKKMFLIRRIIQLQDQHMRPGAIQLELGIPDYTYFYHTHSKEFAKEQENYRNRIVKSKDMAIAFSAADALERYYKKCAGLLDVAGDKLEQMLASTDERLALQALQEVRESAEKMQAKSPDELTANMMDKFKDLPAEDELPV